MPKTRSSRPSPRPPAGHADTPSPPTLHESGRLPHQPRRAHRLPRRLTPPRSCSETRPCSWPLPAPHPGGAATGPCSPTSATGMPLGDDGQDLSHLDLEARTVRCTGRRGRSASSPSTPIGRGPHCLPRRCPAQPCPQRRRPRPLPQTTGATASPPGFGLIAKSYAESPNQRLPHPPRPAPLVRHPPLAKGRPAAGRAAEAGARQHLHRPALPRCPQSLPATGGLSAAPAGNWIPTRCCPSPVGPRRRPAATRRSRPPSSRWRAGSGRGIGAAGGRRAGAGGV